MKDTSKVKVNQTKGAPQKAKFKFLDANVKSIMEAPVPREFLKEIDKINQCDLIIGQLINQKHNLFKDFISESDKLKKNDKWPDKDARQLQYRLIDITYKLMLLTPYHQEIYKTKETKYYADFKKDNVKI